MKKILFITLALLFGSSANAEKKFLILAQGNAWLPSMAKNLIENRDFIEKSPFDGFIMVGNSFTSITMGKGQKLTYENIWNEVKGLKHLYKKKRENFLRVDITFPSDFWDKEAWNQVSKNFEIVAKVAKDLGFRGIAIDDEGYGERAKKMVNYRFPTEKEVRENPKKYTEWQKKGAKHKYVDRLSYNNPKYTFKEHMTQVTSLFKHIMRSMQKSYPNITILVFYGASFAHDNANLQNLMIADSGLPSEQEYKGPIFLGLEQGRDGNATLHDMGENYRYRKESHFKQSHLLRKFKIATNAYNKDLNELHQWLIPAPYRKNWSRNVTIGFMTSNIPLTSSYPEFDTTKKTTKKDIFQATKLALKYSEKYVIYYCHNENWLDPKRKNRPSKRWFNMLNSL